MSRPKPRFFGSVRATKNCKFRLPSWQLTHWAQIANHEFEKTNGNIGQAIACANNAFTAMLGSWPSGRIDISPYEQSWWDWLVDHEYKRSNDIVSALNVANTLFAAMQIRASDNLISKINPHAIEFLREHLKKRRVETIPGTLESIRQQLADQEPLVKRLEQRHLLSDRQLDYLDWLEASKRQIETLQKQTSDIEQFEKRLTRLLARTRARCDITGRLIAPWHCISHPFAIFDKQNAMLGNLQMPYWPGQG